MHGAASRGGRVRDDTDIPWASARKAHLRAREPKAKRAAGPRGGGGGRLHEAVGAASPRAGPRERPGHVHLRILSGGQATHRDAERTGPHEPLLLPHDSRHRVRRGGARGGDGAWLAGHDVWAQQRHRGSPAGCLTGLARGRRGVPVCSRDVPHGEARPEQWRARHGRLVLGRLAPQAWRHRLRRPRVTPPVRGFRGHHAHRGGRSGEAFREHRFHGRLALAEGHGREQRDPRRCGPHHCDAADMPLRHLACLCQLCGGALLLHFGRLCDGALFLHFGLLRGRTLLLRLGLLQGRALFLRLGLFVRTLRC
mmetsp:Transcript_19264/g.50880  ORF Transcript_19264/g.50880 Transcript_19264/m.50880 type:complete len:310 (-) Transcript_19264:634-1563(-)